MTEEKGTWRVKEVISVICPNCGDRVEFSPIVSVVTIRNAHDSQFPALLVGLQPGYTVEHTCVSEKYRLTSKEIFNFYKNLGNTNDLDERPLEVIRVRKTGFWAKTARFFGFIE